MICIVIQDIGQIEKQIIVVKFELDIIQLDEQIELLVQINQEMQLILELKILLQLVLGLVVENMFYILILVYWIVQVLQFENIVEILHIDIIDIKQHEV